MIFFSADCPLECFCIREIDRDTRWEKKISHKILNQKHLTMNLFRIEQRTEKKIMVKGKAQSNIFELHLLLTDVCRYFY